MMNEKVRYGRDYKPCLHFRSRHETGNVFALLSMVRNALRKMNRTDDFNTMRDRVFDTHSYQEALNVMREYVYLIDDDRLY